MDLVTFTEEIFNGKLHLLCRAQLFSHLDKRLNVPLQIKWLWSQISLQSLYSFLFLTALDLLVANIDKLKPRSFK